MKIKLFALALSSFLIISCNKDFTDCKKFIGTWYGKCNTQENSNLKCETCKTLEINIKDDECFISTYELPTFGSSCGISSKIYSPNQIDCENGKLQIGGNKSEITISDDHKKIYFQGEEYFIEEEALPTSVESAIVLKRQMNGQGEGNIRVVQLIKTNGTEREFNGQKMYTMEWQATLKFDKECWSSNMNGFAGGFYSERFIFSENQKDVYMEAFISKYKHYEKGSQMTLTGKYDFQKTENGWKVQGQVVKRNKGNLEQLESEYKKTDKEKKRQDSIYSIEVAAKRKMDSLFNAASSSMDVDKFIGSWAGTGENKEWRIDIRRQNNTFKILDCHLNPLTEGYYYFGKYENGKLIVTGFDASRFYKFQIPVFKILATGELLYTDGVGETTLKKSLVEISSYNRTYSLLNPTNGD